MPPIATATDHSTWRLPATATILPLFLHVAAPPQMRYGEPTVVPTKAPEAWSPLHHARPVQEATTDSAQPLVGRQGQAFPFVRSLQINDARSAVLY